MKSILPALFVALALAGQVHGTELVGKVVKIQDRDTLSVLVSRKQIKVRLLDIDAPERKQPFGSRSRQSLAELCAGKNARVVEQGEDRYGRTLGRVYCAGVGGLAKTFNTLTGRTWTVQQPASTPIALPGR